jgi:hypothetical protein
MHFPVMSLTYRLPGAENPIRRDMLSIFIHFLIKGILLSASISVPAAGADGRI